MAEQQISNTTANKRIARNSIFLSIRMVIVLGITLYTTRAILQLLGVEDYGVYNVVCGFVSMFTFLNTSLSNGIQRFFNYELGKNGIDGAKRVYNTSLLIQILLAVIIIIITEALGLWYLYNKMVIPESRMVAAQWIFQFSVLSFMFIIIQAPYSAAVMAHEKMDFFAAVSILDALLKLLIVFIIPFFSGDNLTIYGLLIALISIFDFICYLVYSKKHFDEIKLESKFDKELFKSMMRFSGWNTFGSFSGIMKEQGINLVINLFFGPIVNAARGVSTQVNSGLQGFVSTITTPVRPQVIQSYARGDVDRTMHLTYSISKLSCMFLYMMALPIICEIDYILKLWLGGNVPENTNKFVIIVILISFLNNLNSAVSGVVHASGKMKAYQLSTSLLALLCIPLSYFALKMGGSADLALWMVFITMAITQTVALMVLKTIVQYRLKDYFIKVISPIVSVALTTFWIPSLITSTFQEGLLRLCIVFITSVLLVSISVLFMGLNRGERTLIFQMISNKINK